eukprot:XP_016868390.1 putative C-mannosyltransferase DPY19L2P2 [Homo sapiens]
MGMVYGTQLGGLITVLCCFFNHGEVTRVMWTPPLRESFSYPFLVLQMYILTLILRTSSNDRRPFIALCLSNVAFMLPWQFAQFILFTQIASLFPMYVVGYIKPSKFQKISYLNMVTFLIYCKSPGHEVFILPSFLKGMFPGCRIAG